MAAFFPLGQKSLEETRKKFLHDLPGVAKASAHGLVLVSNQTLSLSDRRALKVSAGETPVQLYHLERIATILDQPLMSAVRKQFLGIDFDPSISLALQTLSAPGRTEDEIREAIKGLAAARQVLLNRNAGEGEQRCTACGAPDIIHSVHSFDEGELEIWFCGECGEHLGDCV